MNNKISSQKFIKTLVLIVVVLVCGRPLFYPLPVEAKFTYGKAKSIWPMVVGKTGPYSLNVSSESNEIYDVAADNHKMVITTNITDPVVKQRLTDLQITYISRMPWSILINECLNKYNPHQCLIDQDQELQDKVLNKIGTFLNSTEVKMDSRIIGFWILDDYPGDVRKTLEKIKQLIVLAPSPFPRPTVCGFGGRLSKKSLVDESITNDFGSSNLAISNFTPKGCDIAMYYPYAKFDSALLDSELVDWEMTTLLPHMLTRTINIGKANDNSWDPNTLIWGALVHAFGDYPEKVNGYQLPRYEDVLLQAESYCKGGASLLGFFSWHSGEGDSRIEIFNNPELRKAAKDASSQCSEYWSSKIISGDANFDEKVNGLDYVVWLLNYNVAIKGSNNGDFDEDGIVDGKDYIIWLNNYNDK